MKLVARCRPRPQDPELVTIRGRELASSDRRENRSRGQVLVIFAGAAFVLFALSALVIDVSWYWANTLRVQRAADAAALAGVVSLPGDVAGARTDAASAAVANGYSVTNGCKADLATPSAMPGICINPDPNDDRQLDVVLAAPVNTFFMRLIGINSITATRASKAKYVVPVPMGSPEAYYGIYRLTCVPGKTGCPSGTNYNTIGAAPGDTAGPPRVQGFFGAVSSQGGFTTNGDLINPAMDGSVANPNYNAQGYFYTIQIPSDGGAVYVFDPTFCALGPAGSSTYGMGDHWVGTPNSNGMSTFYTLWNTNGLPLIPSRWTKVASSGSMFQKEFQSDQSGVYGSPASGTGTDCSAANLTLTPNMGEYWHNKWWAIGQTTASPTAAQTSLAAGTYQLQIATTDSTNPSTNVQNMFAIGVVDGTGSSPQVYGSGTMANWYNITGGTSTFYLAQIANTYAGKTLRINLFDVGDNSSNSYLKIKSPDGGTQNYVGFTWSAAKLDGTSASSGSVTAASSGLQVTSGSTAKFNDEMLTITIPLGSSYGTTLWQNGWWQVEYNVASANDLTTWAVDVLGNPVHLVVP